MAQLQFFGDRLIAIDVCVMEVIQEATPLADHHQQPAPGAVILLVCLKVLGQVINPLCQKRNLDIRRPRVLFMQFELLNGFRFCFHTLLIPQEIQAVECSFLLQGCKALSWNPKSKARHRPVGRSRRHTPPRRDPHPKRLVFRH
jgi:hypothetical protein